MSHTGYDLKREVFKAAVRGRIPNVTAEGLALIMDDFDENPGTTAQSMEIDVSLVDIPKSVENDIYRHAAAYFDRLLLDCDG